jgi:ADP-ribose pyrophosphatase YjhB (NUDIX family)
VSVSDRDLARWSETLAAIGRTGLGFTSSGFEQERYREVLKVAAEIRSKSNLDDAESGIEDSAGESLENTLDAWLASVIDGVPGYVTPKIAIGAVVGNDKGEILLVQRKDSGVWLYPTGWADVGYSASEVVAKEVKEETGIDATPLRIIALFDGLRLGFSRFAFYSLVFHCHSPGGEVTPHPLECADAGWFSFDDLPSPIIGLERWGDLARRAIAGEPVEAVFDLPRNPPWRS